MCCYNRLAEEEANGLGLPAIFSTRCVYSVGNSDDNRSARNHPERFTPCDKQSVTSTSHLPLLPVAASFLLPQSSCTDRRVLPRFLEGGEETPSHMELYGHEFLGGAHTFHVRCNQAKPADKSLTPNSAHGRPCGDDSSSTSLPPSVCP